MSALLVTLVKELRTRIESEGAEVNGTLELTGIRLPPLQVHVLDLLEEENGIREYYAERKINTQVIRSLEHNLYELIYRGLRQAVEQTLYFDRTQDYTSRRFVFSTTDCISNVQILYRNGVAKLFAHIRSTDVVKLLPWDLLFLCKLINRVLQECEFPLTEEREVVVTIGSAHYYLTPDSMY